MFNSMRKQEVSKQHIRNIYLIRLVDNMKKTLKM